MVDINKIERDLRLNFSISVYAKVKIDPHTGIVDVEGNVQLKVRRARMPVQFGVVSGEFDCHTRGLTSLRGAPHHVGGSFTCYRNKLKSLAYGPKWVGREYYCRNNLLTNLIGAPEVLGGDFGCVDNPLTSLEGLPSEVKRLSLTYTPHLPLLRAIASAQILSLRRGYISPTMLEIVEKYMGQGKAGVLNCALELKKAGFEDNAKW